MITKLLEFIQHESDGNIEVAVQFPTKEIASS